MKAKIFNDKLHRLVVAQHEVQRNTLRYMTHNQALPLNVRYVAQFQLSQLPKVTTEHHLSRRCMLTGRGKGIIREFNMARHQFRQLALQGKLPGVRTASW